MCASFWIRLKAAIVVSFPSSLWGFSPQCRCHAVLTKMLLDVPFWQTVYSHNTYTQKPVLAQNLCHMFPCFIFYHIKYNWHFIFSFHAYRRNSVFSFLKWQCLCLLEHLHVLCMFVTCPFVACLCGHLLLKLWTCLLHCSYSFSQCG
jgi:hypothetical protein